MLPSALHSPLKFRSTLKINFSNSILSYMKTYWQLLPNATHISYIK